ncbi:hypothetical protein J6590_076674 [Homalodisca vitripennis]|nr:hypothetical protein J6590_076674 [Homalodisca vitripennis]
MVPSEFGSIAILHGTVQSTLRLRSFVHPDYPYVNGTCTALYRDKQKKWLILRPGASRNSDIRENLV